MDLLEALRNTPTARRFSESPVPDGVLHRVLDSARFAPSGGNRQGWSVIVVRDAATRRTLRDLYLEAWIPYLARGRAALGPDPDPVRLRVMERTDRFAQDLHKVPVHLLVAVDLRALTVTDKELPRQSIVGGGSIYPFTHNILLAARGEGLAAALTTLIVPAEGRLREMFGIPEEFAVAALIALGWPAEPLDRRLTRKPVEEFAHLERFDGEPLSSG